MKDLFGQDSLPNIAKVRGKRKAEILHAQLIMAYGAKDGICKDCFFRKRFSQGSKTWSKCEKATLGGHIATDWRVAWQACGLFQAESKNK